VNGMHSSGTHDPRFDAVVDAFDGYLADVDDYGAQLSIYWRGVPVIDRWGGVEATDQSVTGIFSAGKGIAALCIATLIDSGELDLDTPVAHYWPEFGAGGKGDITVRTALSHRAGVIGVPGGFDQKDLSTGFSAREKLAAVRPYWRPGADFGYHAITIGMLMEGLFLAIRGEELQTFHAREMRGIRGVDVFLGLPESDDPRFVPVRPAAIREEDRALREMMAAIWGDPDGLTAVAMNMLAPPSETGVPGDVSPNIRSIRAFGGSGHAATGAARGLARSYAMALGDVDGHGALFGEETRARMSALHSHGTDMVLGAEMGFGIVFMKPVPRLPFASHAAFGHDGAGGALGFADPNYDLGFGYVPYPMQPPGGADPKAIELSRITREVIRDITA
jgi:CubicO group peptidase (beta-lactamase class C family)